MGVHRPASEVVQHDRAVGRGDETDDIERPEVPGGDLERRPHQDSTAVDSDIAIGVGRFGYRERNTYRVLADVEVVKPSYPVSDMAGGRGGE